MGRRCAISAGIMAALVWSAPELVSAERAQSASALRPVLESHDLIILGDVKHGVQRRISFFSSEKFFAEMAAGSVRHVAIEIPRVLGRQAMGVETEADVEAFAQDVIRSGRWHFVDPDHPQEDAHITQHRVATAIARQVLRARQFGINPIFYDFNNPLGGFRTLHDPVYRCIAELTSMTWLRYGLDEEISKADRDAAIMRERFSHDDELAAYIESEMSKKGGGKLVVIPGYAHAVVPQGLADRLEQRLARTATVVGVFADGGEEAAFAGFLSEQAQLLQIDLSRAPNYRYRISTDTLEVEQHATRYARLDYRMTRRMPPVCHQVAEAQ